LVADLMSGPSGMSAVFTTASIGRAMFVEVRGKVVFDGVRGADPADVDAFIETVAAENYFAQPEAA
jgi:hypothetical protein